MSYKLNKRINIKAVIIATKPPIKPAKNCEKKFRHIFETKLPNKEQGRAINKYFEIILKYLKLKFGMAFLILDKFSNEIVDIERKKGTITEFIPINGVKPIKPANKTIEPIT